MADRAPLRIQLRRAKGWKMPGNTVRVARPSEWGNPFRIGPQETRTGFRDVSAEEVVATYLKLLNWRMSMDCTVGTGLVERLRGRNLACWCRMCPAHAAGKPLGIECGDCAPCHADILGSIANG